MIRKVLAMSFLLTCGINWAKDRHPTAPIPDQFTIGRLTFLDFGPPFDYYEVLVARPIASGTSIERVLLTPPGDACFQSAKVEMASAKLNESIEELFQKTNPCAIPEKELHHELKRCKKCLAFSGAHVNMQVQCGPQARMIRSEILDKDMFDPAANTPIHTSWTMQLLDRLDKALGPGAMDKPIFPISESDQAPAMVPDSQSLKDLAAGKYDALFPGASDKPSDLHRAAQIHPPTPTIRLAKNLAIQPLEFALPKYPPLARLAHIQGEVVFKFEIGQDGSTSNFMLVTGHPLLSPSVKDAVERWNWPPHIRSTSYSPRCFPYTTTRRRRSRCLSSARQDSRTEPLAQGLLCRPRLRVSRLLQRYGRRQRLAEKRSRRRRTASERGRLQDHGAPGGSCH